MLQVWFIREKIILHLATPVPFCWTSTTHCAIQSQREQHQEEYDGKKGGGRHVCNGLCIGDEEEAGSCQSMRKRVRTDHTCSHSHYFENRRFLPFYFVQQLCLPKGRRCMEQGWVLRVAVVSWSASSQVLGLGLQHFLFISVDTVLIRPCVRGGIIKKGEPFLCPFCSPLCQGKLPLGQLSLIAVCLSYQSSVPHICSSS